MSSLPVSPGPFCFLDSETPVGREGTRCTQTHPRVKHVRWETLDSQLPSAFERWLSNPHGPGADPPLLVSYHSLGAAAPPVVGRGRQEGGGVLTGACWPREYFQDFSHSRVLSLLLFCCFITFGHVSPRVVGLSFHCRRVKPSTSLPDESPLGIPKRSVRTLAACCTTWPWPLPQPRQTPQKPSTIC